MVAAQVVAASPAARVHVSADDLNLQESQSSLIGENKCYHRGSDQHRRPECKSLEKMMRDHSEAKPGEAKAKRKRWPDYKSALAKARCAQKLKDKKENDKMKKGSVSAVNHSDDNDSASDNDDTYS